MVSLLLSISLQAYPFLPPHPRFKQAIHCTSPSSRGLYKQCQAGYITDKNWIYVPEEQKIRYTKNLYTPINATNILNKIVANQGILAIVKLYPTRKKETSFKLCHIVQVVGRNTIKLFCGAEKLLSVPIYWVWALEPYKQSS